MEDADRLAAAFRARASQYKRAEVRLALVRDTEMLQLLRGVVRFDREETKKSGHLNYGPLVLTKQSLGVEEGFRFLSGLLEGKIPSGSDFSLEEAFQLIDRSRVEPTSLPSPIGRWSRFSDWPAEMFVIRRLANVIEINRDNLFITFERSLGQRVQLAIRVIREIRERDYETGGTRYGRR